MKHLGDITKIDGFEVPIVDCLIGGSPCQDLSVAGKREGMLHEASGDAKTTRSGLFMEQIRLVKEMREHDKRNGATYIRPRLLVWENVYGAFSSSGKGGQKGADFAAVLEEILKVVQENAHVDVPKGGWSPCGCIFTEDGGASVAWRVLDSQFWGVPQRRRRIALVADFGGESAPEILFVRNGVSGYPGTGDEKGQGTASDPKEGIGRRDIAYTMQDREGRAGGGKGALIQKDRSAALRTCNNQYLFQPTECFAGNIGMSLRFGNHFSEGVSPTLSTSVGDNCPVCIYEDEINGAVPIENHPSDSRVKFSEDGNFQTLTSRMGTGGGNVPLVLEAHTEQPIRAAFRKKAHKLPQEWEEATKADTLNTFDNCETRTPILIAEGKPIAFGISSDKSNAMLSDNPHSGIYEADTSRTLDANGGNPTCNQGGIAIVCVDQGGGKSGANFTEDGKTPTLCTTHGGEPVIALDRAAFNQGKNAQFDIGVADDGVAQTCVAKGPGAVAYAIETYHGYAEEELSPPIKARDYKDPHVVVVPEIRYVVRRLTPLECERLQGFPDGWTDIGEYTDSKGKAKSTSDSARYKALGNSISLPPWRYVLKKIAACYERPATMASVFDGIGGFPLIWEGINGKGSAIWASEIEEFPIAVTERRINNNEN